MTTKLLVCVVVSLLASLTVSRTQTDKKKIRTETRIWVAPGPSPEERKPGDVFAVDITNGDIVAGSLRRDGTTRSVLLPLATKINPTVTGTFQSPSPYSVRYRYSIQNGAGAKQPIWLFAVAMENPSQITNLQAPPGWNVGGPSPAPGSPPVPPGKTNPSRQNWWAVGDGLLPGTGSEGFSFDASSLPGLTKTYIQGRNDQVIPGGTEGLSIWVLNQISRAWELQNNSVQPLTIGPKIALAAQTRSQDIIRGIHAELSGALAVPEIAQNNPSLSNLVKAFEAADKATAISYRSAFAEMGTTPLEKAFFRAMAFNLDYLDGVP